MLNTVKENNFPLVVKSDYLQNTYYIFRGNGKEVKVNLNDISKTLEGISLKEYDEIMRIKKGTAYQSCPNH